jgi:membrane protease YdiL (CAAX protease family)
MVVALVNLTALHFQTNGKPTCNAILPGCLAILPLALMEEVGFRAYPFLKLNKSFGLRITLLITALAFGAYHGWSTYMSFTGPFVWAFVFGLSAIWSRGIAMPTGIHVALNIGQSLVGLSGNTNPIWKVDYLKVASKADIAKTAHVSLALHLLVLLCAVGLMEIFIRRNKAALH